MLPHGLANPEGSSPYRASIQSSRKKVCEVRRLRQEPEKLAAGQHVQGKHQRFDLACD